MKLTYPIILILVFVFAGIAQRPDDILATATGHTFHLRDLPAGTQKWVEDLPVQTRATRAELLDQMVNEIILELEAKTTNTTLAKLIADERAKVPAPTEAEIKAFYDAKKDSLGGQPLEQMRQPIVNYLRGQAEQKKLSELVLRLRTKHKFVAGKDINAVGLGGIDDVATINGRAITAKEYEGYARFDLYNLRASVGEQILNNLNDAISTALVTDEAKALGIAPDALIAREITNKMRDFSDDERDTLTDSFRKSLFAKYQVKVLYKAPEPPVQVISVDDDPATGPPTAPVTIVMFSDFQCSACSATHPVLKKVIAGYPGKIRFVVRDFPLESVHANAWRASLAAGAANAQGKFFEYAEILYTHQDALDDESLKKYAAQLGLNVKQFELDFNSDKMAAEVRKDMADGESYSVNGTPTIFVNGVRVRNLSLYGFRDAIDKALQK